jgi:hypothetical protein
MSDTKPDRELLELAAKAADIPATWDEEGGFMVMPDPSRSGPCRRAGDRTIWNPLEYDEHAFRMAVALNIETVPQKVWIWASHPCGVFVREALGFDPCAATRRAIVRAAAAMAPQENSDEWLDAYRDHRRQKRP